MSDALAAAPLVAPPLVAAVQGTDGSVQEALLGYAFVGIPLGLLLGLVLGLVARREDGWGGYSSFSRRATRLAHVAAVMLPALAGLYALLLPATAAVTGAALWGTRLWIAGGTALPVALVVAAFRPRLTPLVVPAALSLVAAAGLFAGVWIGGGS